MPYTLPTQEDIRDAILTDWRNSDSLVDAAVDSDNYIRASGIASAVLGLYQFAAWGVNQYFPDTADIDNLVRFASVRGIARIPAVSAAGTIKFFGVASSNIPIGTLVQTSEGKQYQTTAAASVNENGEAIVVAIAVNPGSAGNQPNNTPVILQTAPVGIDTNAVLLQMQDGFDAEALASLLERVLDHLQHPPAGGNKYDYVRWAKEVAGVTSAYVYPLRRGVGTVDIAILSNGMPSSDELRIAVFDYINPRHPAGSDFLVLTPSLVNVDINAVVTLADGTLLNDVKVSIENTLTAYFSNLKPGDTVNRSRLLASIADIAGVTDVTLNTPAASVSTLIDAAHIQLAALGTISVT